LHRSDGRHLRATCSPDSRAWQARCEARSLRGCSRRVPRWLGYVSFSLYLIHFPVQCLFHAVQPQAGLSYQSPLVFAAFMISSLAAASLVARGFEWPVYRLLTGRQLK